MKILHVTPLYHPSSGGAERHVKEVSERLARRGHQVTVLTLTLPRQHEYFQRSSAVPPAFEGINGVPVTRLDPCESLVFRLLEGWTHLRGGYRSLSLIFTYSGLELLLYSLPRNLQLLQAILRTPADVVVSWNWMLGAAYHAYLARRLKRFTLVGVPLFHTEDAWSRRPIYDHMIEACDGLVVNTAHEADYIRHRVPGVHRIALGGAGVDPDCFARRNGPRFRAHHALGNDPLVGFVGRICAGKGVPALLEAMPSVWKSSRRARLVVAGYCSTDSEPDRLLRALAPHERERVLLLPNLAEEDKADLYDALDVFVMPSLSDSFGISYLEAWMCRKPVVGSRNGAPRCVIEDGADGLTVDPKDPDEIARAICALLADPDRRARMGERGHAKAMENFTWHAVTDRFERFCSDLVAERTAATRGGGTREPAVPGPRRGVSRTARQPTTASPRRARSL